MMEAALDRSTADRSPPTRPPWSRWLGPAVCLLLLAVASAAGAYHLSAGASDTAATTSTEAPRDPSVTAEMHERGLARDCYAPDGNDPDPQAAWASDGFCGRLVYEAGTSFEQASPPDQQLPSDAVGSFDVVYTNYVGTYGIGTCSPWCWPGGEPVYRSTHDAGAQLGLTPTGDAAYEADQGWQTYGGDLAHPNAARLLQTTTGAWEANGWMHPVPDQSFVGFLEDPEGQAIDDERLPGIVADAEALPEDAIPRVCGFTPDAEISSGGPSACEVPFNWRGASQDEEACSSPTYACGALTPAWHAQIACLAAGSGCGGTLTGGPDPVRGDHLGPASSANDYDVWHWVLAPSPSACEGAQEPGFDVDPDAQMPYLAHDLDVYTPAASAAGVTQTGNLAKLGYATAGDAVSDLPAIPGEVDPGDGVEPATTLVAKEDRVEPNAPGDTSQSHVQVDRDLDEDPCAPLLDSTEDPAYVDPWVDVIDTQVYRNLWLDSILGVDPWIEGLDRRSYQRPPTTGVFGDANDAYASDDEGQDASNRPGPWMYSAGGQVGVFTDRDDDGRYDQAPNSRLFEAVGDVGAYPMFWDIRVDDTGTIDADAGCRLDETTRLSQAMAEAGYGPRTGMIMIVHKTEPTVLYDWRTSEVFGQPEPEQAYVLLSQSLQAQREDPVVQEAIAGALDRVPADVSPGSQQVVYPGQWTAPPSDFYEQCGYPTGGFHTSWSFTHAAHASPGDTIVTAYVFENTAQDGILGGSGLVPAFQPGGDAYAFPSGVNLWFDVDPIDGDPARNTERCSAPPHDGDRC